MELIRECNKFQKKLADYCSEWVFLVKGTKWNKMNKNIKPESGFV